MQKAGVAVLVDETSLVSFLSRAPVPSFPPDLWSISHHTPPTPSLNPELSKMPGTENAPRKRKAESGGAHDGGNKRAKVSSFSSYDSEILWRCRLGRAVPFSFCSCRKHRHAESKC